MSHRIVKDTTNQGTNDKHDDVKEDDEKNAPGDKVTEEVGDLDNQDKTKSTDGDLSTSQLENKNTDIQTEKDVSDPKQIDEEKSASKEQNSTTMTSNDDGDTTKDEEDIKKKKEEKE